MCLLFFRLKLLHVKDICLHVEQILSRRERVLRQHDGYSDRRWNTYHRTQTFQTMGSQKMYEFPDKNWKSSALIDLLRKIDKTGDVQCYPGSGRPRTGRVPDNISTAEYLILSQDNGDTHAGPQEIEHATVISRSFVPRIARNDIGLRVLFKRKRAKVNPDVLSKFDANAHAYERIQFSNEKIFLLTAPLNRQNDRVYSKK